MGMSIISGNIKYVFTQALAPTGEGEVEGSLWYNTTLNRLELYDGASWVAIVTPSSTECVILYPKDRTEIIQGTWKETVLTGTRGVAYDNSTTHTINDRINFQTYLSAGTYTFFLAHWTNNNQGICHVEIDGNEVGTIDTYESSQTKTNDSTITSINVATTGLKTIGLKIASKNDSSSDYSFYFNWCGFLKTA